MTVDVITTTYNNIDKFKICLSTVIERTKYVDYKWYLWCNDPSDEVKKVVHDAMYIDDILFNNRIEPIFNDTNNGSFSSNNNEAVAEGNSEYILFLNDDVEPINDTWLLSMTKILDTDPKVGAVGSLLVYPDRNTIQHCGVFFSNRTNNLPFHMLYKQNINTCTDFISKPRYYQAVTGACLLARRSDFETIGGFDENFYYCYEDIGLCLDIHDKCKKMIVYTPGAQLIHHEGISAAKKNNSHLQENIAVFKNKYANKHYNDYEFYMQNLNHMIYKAK